MVPQYFDISFKKDGVTVYQTQAALGCLRRGEPQDNYDLIADGLLSMQQDINAGHARSDVNAYTSVEVNGCEYSYETLRTAGIAAPRRTCGTPKPRHLKP